MTSGKYSPREKQVEKQEYMFSIRVLVVILTTLATVITYLSRQCLSIALVFMTKNDRELIVGSGSIMDDESHQLLTSNSSQVTTVDEIADGVVEQKNDTTIFSYGPKYSWTASDKGLVLETFFWTYVIFQIPVARLAESMSASWCIALVGVGSTVVSLVSPWAASIHPYLFALTRALLGIAQTSIFPAGYVLYTKWLPPVERSQALPFLSAGAYVGSILASIMTGYFSERESFGWEYAFYMAGVICMIWSILWILLVTSEPKTNRFISQAELDYIEKNLEVKSVDSEPKDPDWMKILTSQPVIALCISSFASNWAFAITMLLVPTYLNYVLRVPPFMNGVINSVIYAIFCISSPIVGYVSTVMIRKRPLGITHLQVRKLFQLTALYGQAACFILLTFSNYNQDLALAILYTQTFLYSSVAGGENQLPSEISVDFAGTIYAISNCIGSATGFLIPRLYSMIVTLDHDQGQWSAFFYTAAVIIIVCGTIFLIMGSNSQQDFTKKSPESSKKALADVELGVIEKEVK